MTPIRIDFAGGWLDVPRFAIPGAYIVNCTVTPGIRDFEWQPGGGVGGSAAIAIDEGRDALTEELARAGWQDPAVIQETGLCVWRSGSEPVLQARVNPDFLSGVLALWWTGKRHDTKDLVALPRDYRAIWKAGQMAAASIMFGDLDIAPGIVAQYEQQVSEGMAPLPVARGARAMKYCGAGHGGYALYLFGLGDCRDEFCNERGAIPIEPYMRPTR